MVHQWEGMEQNQGDQLHQHQCTKRLRREKKVVKLGVGQEKKEKKKKKKGEHEER